MYESLKNLMVAIAPNLTIIIGEFVGARIFSLAGSLMNLAKQPASTVQIIGANEDKIRHDNWERFRKDRERMGMSMYHDDKCCDDQRIR